MITKEAKLSISYRKESKSGHRSYAQGDRFKTRFIIAIIERDRYTPRRSQDRSLSTLIAK